MFPKEVRNKDNKMKKSDDKSRENHKLTLPKDFRGWYPDNKH